MTTSLNGGSGPCVVTKGPNDCNTVCGIQTVLFTPDNALGIQMQQATFEVIHLTCSKAPSLAKKRGRGFWNPPPKKCSKLTGGKMYKCKRLLFLSKLLKGCQTQTEFPCETKPESLAPRPCRHNHGKRNSLAQWNSLPFFLSFVAWV